MSTKKKAKATDPARKAPNKAGEPLPIQSIALDKIDPSPLNRDCRNVDELVPSIREHGVQQPIKLRPKGDRFEIVYGERRFNAAKKLCFAAIPATVEDLTDAEAHTLRVVENACRTDPHPLEEAEAYEGLLAMKDAAGKQHHTAESLAKLVGRCAQYVYSRLRLTALGDEMRGAFRAGELTTTTAFLVARAVPRDLQAQALADFRKTFLDRDDGEPFPAEDVRYYIDQNYLTRLDRAPFALYDANLLPEAGPCTTCAKRTGNQPTLFANDTPEDLCSDVLCLRKKLEAHRTRLAADVVAKGGIVLTEQQSNSIYKASSQLPWNTKYIDVDSRAYEDPQQRTWRALLGDLCPTLTLAVDPHGAPHALLLKTDALGALKQAGVDFAEMRRKASHQPDTDSEGGADQDLDEDHHGGSDDEPNQEPTAPAAARAEAEVRRATISNVLATIVAAAAARSPDDPALPKLILAMMIHGGFHDAISDTVKRRALDRPKGERAEDTLSAHAASLDTKDLSALVLELALARGAYLAWSSTYSERLIEAAAAYAIDIKAVETSTAATVAAARAERAAKKASKRATKNAA